MQTKAVSSIDSNHQISPQKPQSTLLDLGIIWIIPLVQAVINDAWLYQPIGWLDPWYYLGYGLNYYSDPTFPFPGYYKSSRLPWIFLEFIARHLFNPILASWVLQLGTLALGSTSLYFLFSRTLGRNAAFVGAALFAAFPFVHGNGGADYQNALAGPLYCLTWWLAIRAADLGLTANRLFWIGAAVIATIHTNVVFINLLPVTALHFFWTYLDKHRKLPPLLPLILWSGTGAVAITIILALVNRSVGRPLLFFLPQFRLAGSFVANPSHQQPWYQAWSSGWYLASYYLGPFIAALVLAMVTFIAATCHKHRQVMVFCVCYIFAALLWIFWQSVGQTALQQAYFYFAYPLAFPFVGVITASFAFWAPQRSLNLFAKLAIPTIIIGILANYCNILQKYNILPQIPILNATIFGLIFCAIIFLTPKIVRFWAAIFTLSVSVAFGTLSAQHYSPFHCHVPRELEKAIDSAHRLIRAEQRANGLHFYQVFLWAEGKEQISFPAHCPTSPTDNLSDFEASLTSTGFAYLEPSWGVKNMEDISRERFESAASPKGLVVFITKNTDRVDQLAKRFTALGITPTNNRFEIVKTEITQIPIYMFLVTKK